MARTTRRGFFKTTAALAGAHTVSRALGGSASAKAAKPPNILFFFPDQHRYDWVSGNPAIPVRTPHLDALAARGVRFDRAYCPSPLCAPSRACLASGREYDRCRVASNKVDYPLDAPTVYGRLRDAGYHVAGCGKFDLHKATKNWGRDGKRCLADWGFSDGIDNEGKWDAIGSGKFEPAGPYMAFLHDRGLAAMHVADFLRRRREGQLAAFPTPLPEEAYCDNWIAQNGLDLMARFPKDRPWFLQVNFAGPHNPWDITERMDARRRGTAYPPPDRSTEGTPETHNAVRENYALMVENLDRWLGAYIEAIAERGELEHTLIVYSSDHGEMLGDQDLWGKRVWPEPSVSVPLMAAGPGVKPLGRSRAPVSLTDLTATFLDMGGADPLEGVEGRSLRPLFAGETDRNREHVFAGLEGWRMVTDGRYKLVAEGAHSAAILRRLDAGRGLRLYDLDADRQEHRNLADDEPDRAQALAKVLRAQLERGQAESG